MLGQSPDTKNPRCFTLLKRGLTATIDGADGLERTAPKAREEGRVGRRRRQALLLTCMFCLCLRALKHRLHRSRPVSPPGYAFFSRALSGSPLPPCRAVPAIGPPGLASVQEQALTCVLDHPLQALAEIQAGHGTAGHDGPLVRPDGVEPEPLCVVVIIGPATRLPRPVHSFIVHSPRAPRPRSWPRPRRFCF